MYSEGEKSVVRVREELTRDVRLERWLSSTITSKPITWCT